MSIQLYLLPFTHMFFLLFVGQRSAFVLLPLLYLLAFTLSLCLFWLLSFIYFPLPLCPLLSGWFLPALFSLLSYPDISKTERLCSSKTINCFLKSYNRFFSLCLSDFFLGISGKDFEWIQFHSIRKFVNQNK